MNVNVATTIFSEIIPALFRRFFPDDPNKLLLANMVEVISNSTKVMQSRCIEDEESHLKCAYGFYLEEQTDANMKVVRMLRDMDYWTTEGPGPKGSGPKLKTNYLHFPDGAELAVSGIHQLHVDVKVISFSFLKRLVCGS